MHSPEHRSSQTHNHSLMVPELYFPWSSPSQAGLCTCLPVGRPPNSSRAHKHRETLQWIPLHRGAYLLR